jgi:DNA-binding NarL/FixJ family response regulator
VRVVFSGATRRRRGSWRRCSPSPPGWWWWTATWRIRCGVHHRHAPHAAEPLTPRETEVLQLLVGGFSNKRIASALAISEHTAKFHVNSILAKLGARGRTDAVVRAARLGLVVL